MKSSSLTRLIAGVLPAILLASSAHAYRQPTQLPERPYEVNKAAQLAQPTARKVAAVAPASRAAAAFTRFTDRHGAWKALWDAGTSVPLRLYGEGIAAPGSNADATIAARAARTVLDEQLALVAPGARAADFTLLRNQVRAGIRQVVFGQRHDGLEVVGAEVSFTFAHDRLVVIGSTAAPDLAVAAPTTSISRGAAAAKATGWIASLYRAAPTALATGDAVVLPVGKGARVVVPVIVDQASPRGQWSVYVDAATGEPVARRQRLMFGEATLRYHVPTRYPGGGSSDYVAPFTTHAVDGSAATSNAAGLVTWTGTADASINPGLTGPYASLTVATGPSATDTLTVPSGGAAIWDQTSVQLLNAQLTTFIHASIAKQFALTTLDPDLPWLSQPIPLVVNETAETGGYQCNAFSNLDDIHFFVADSVDVGDGTFFNCGNTGELADVVYHEFGHSLHGNASGQGFDIDPALSEGLSDYLAATMVDDPDMGKGFDRDNPAVGLRHIDPPDHEYSWPTDISWDPHATGQIISGALWDLRKALVAELGQEAGVALADDIFYGVLSRSTDIPSTLIEALVTDDDDGDLSNGTPHQCLISDAFSAHGLGEAASALAALAPPTLDGLAVRLDKPALPTNAACPSAQVSSVTATWRVRGEPSRTGVVTLTEGADAYTGTLPADAVNEVLEFQVRLALDDGATRTFPENPSDPYYQAFVGTPVVLYCTDFETDPADDDWTLGGFSWGAPQGAADPAAAASGTRVLGTALGGDGVYSSDGAYRAVSPDIDTTGFAEVHLQYRRWLSAEEVVFDQAQVLVNGAEVWINPETESFFGFHDAEWRFQDIDISAALRDDSAQVEFTLTSDFSVEYGGWNLDDVCVVGIGAAPARCGDGVVATGEACDDGNTTAGDGCSATCAVEPVVEEPEDDGGCCSTGGGGNPGALLLAFATLGLAVGRRRRRGGAVG